MAKLEIDGTRYTVVERLGYNHDMGGYASIVMVDGKEKTAVKQCGHWRFWTPADRIAPLVQHINRCAKTGEAPFK